MVDKESKASFAHDLEAIHLFIQGKAKVTLGDLEGHLEGRGFATLALILSVPFIQPIPLPGVSVAFGVAQMALGMRLIFGAYGGLPGWVKKREVETQTVSRVVLGGAKLFAKVERLFKPRLLVLLKPPFENLIGVFMITSGIALSLPLPPVILFSNSIPAWSIILLSLGYLERDGFFVLLGFLGAIATWVYFGLWWEVIAVGLVKVSGYFNF